MKKYRGIIPTVHNVSEKAIKKVMDEYRKSTPEDKRTDLELRPYAVNTILKDKFRYKR